MKLDGSGDAGQSRLIGDPTINGSDNSGASIATNGYKQNGRGPVGNTGRNAPDKASPPYYPYAVTTGSVKDLEGAPDELLDRLRSNLETKRDESSRQTRHAVICCMKLWPGISLEELSRGGIDERCSTRLPFGDRIHDGLAFTLKYLLSVFSPVLTSVSFGLMLKLLDLRHPDKNLGGVGVSIIAGCLVSLGLYVFLSILWKALGKMVGVARPTSETFFRGFLVTSLTIGLAATLAYVDTIALVLAGSSRPLFLSSFAISGPGAICLGLCLSGVYVGALSVSSFACGYNEGSETLMNALAAVHDANEAVEAVKRLEAELASTEKRFEARLNALKAKGQSVTGSSRI